MQTKKDLSPFVGVYNAIGPLERQSLHLQRKIRQAKACRNFKALGRYKAKAAEFQERAKILRQVLKGFSHGYLLALEIDRRQQERKVPRSVVFRRSYSSEAWTEKYS